MASEERVRYLSTPGFYGYSVKFSPFHRDRLAVAAGQNFGLSGEGRLILFDLGLPNDALAGHFEWKDSLFDLTWSEEEPQIVVTASGDGSLQLWDTSKTQAPLMVYKEHTKEASSLDWSQTRDRQVFVSASWDKTLKLWDPNCGRSLLTMTGHEDLVYQAVWSPHLSGCLASVSGDGTLRVWNAKRGPEPSMTIRACGMEGSEVLACDWCKYDRNVIATGDTQGHVTGWDLRRPGRAIFVLKGHGYPVRRVKFSPFDQTQLASVSYDFTTRLWDHELASTSPCLRTASGHTEFVYGLDLSSHVRGLMADCAWDQSVGIYAPQPTAAAAAAAAAEPPT